MEVIEMFEVYRFVVRLGIDVPINEDEFTWENMSWKKALEIVLRGKMYGWAQWHIGKITSKMKALEFWKRLREGILIFGHNMHTINDASRFISMLQKDLNDNNLKGVIMKGPVLAEKIYKGIEYVRPFSDIDLLMKPDDGLYFHRYLIESGKYTVPSRYVNNYDSWMKSCVHMSQHYIPLSNEYGKVEIHHRLNQYFIRNAPNVDVILRNAELCNILGTDVYIPDTFDMFIILCFHMYYHHAYENEFTINRHVDIYKWISYMDLINGDRLKNLKERSDNYGCSSALFYCLYNTNELFESYCGTRVIPQEVIRAFEYPNCIEDVECIRSRFLLSEQTYGKWKIPYKERVFYDKKDLEYEVAFGLYQQTLIERWEGKLNSIGICDLKIQEDGHYW